MTAKIEAINELVKNLLILTDDSKKDIPIKPKKNKQEIEAKPKKNEQESIVQVKPKKVKQEISKKEQDDSYKETLVNDIEVKPKKVKQEISKKEKDDSSKETLVKDIEVKPKKVKQEIVVKETPKKELSAYHIFMKEQMGILKATDDKINSKELLKKVNILWNAKKEKDDSSSDCSSNDTIVKECEVKKKIPISAAMKKLVWNKHIGEEIGKSKCLCCKSTYITQLSFHCGHIVAESKGGNTIVSNLMPICQNCNSSMGSKNMNDFMKTLIFF
jgi:hypothetical protein